MILWTLTQNGVIYLWILLDFFFRRKEIEGATVFD